MPTPSNQPNLTPKCSSMFPDDTNPDPISTLLPPDHPSLSVNAKAIIALRPRFKPLQEHHFCAIELMIRGYSDSAVAKHPTVNKERHTVTRWRLYNPLFRAALSRRRQEVFGTAADRLRITMNKAVSTLRKQLRDENPNIRHRAARDILLLAAARGFAPSPDPIDPMGVMEQIARRKKMEHHFFDDPRFGPLEEVDFLRAMEDLDEHQRNFPLQPDPDLNVYAQSPTPSQPLQSRAPDHPVESPGSTPPPINR